ncbi:MAG: 6,7-dimethyl-8-ribityllumazine synthase [Cyclobacteriaceae bacterium]|nr:6,7-dimethyl-8-ribityllumazine synthase [Cyclobacteriaceae bacterium]
MAGTHTALSDNRKTKPGLAKRRISIVVAEWNADITEALFEGAWETLRKLGMPKDHIKRVTVPGSFELPLAAQWEASKKDVDAVICLGCVIQGETAHFDYICQAVAYGIMRVSLKSSKPVAFGVLTTLDKKQALSRAGGAHGNKGEEAALTVVSMLGH